MSNAATSAPVAAEPNRPEIEPASAIPPAELDQLTEGLVAALKTVYPGRHLRTRPDLQDRDRRLEVRQHRYDLDGSGLSGGGRNAGLGRDRGLCGARSSGRQGQYGVRSAVGSKPHVGRSPGRPRYVVSDPSPTPRAEMTRGTSGRMREGVLRQALGAAQHEGSSEHRRFSP